MTLVIELPDLASQHARNVARWEELVADPRYHDVPDRIETDRHGHVIMHPPPGFGHHRYQGEITALLRHHLGQFAFAECGVSTADGVKIADGAWMSPARAARNEGKVLATTPPEICVEVLSPSNTEAEMAEKRSLYFGAGVDEVWICAEDGTLAFYLRDHPQIAAAASRRCPPFPGKIVFPG